MNKHIFSVTLLSFIFSTASMAQSLSCLLIPEDAESLSLAGATIASGRARDNKLSVGFDYGLWAPDASDISLTSVAAAYTPSKKMRIGLDYRGFGGNEYSISSSIGKVSGSFKPKDMLLGVSLGYSFTDKLDASATIRYISSKIAPKAEGNAIGVDLSIRYKMDNLAVGAGVSNLGSGIDYGEGSYSLPTMLRAGASYNGNGLTALFEVDYLPGESAAMAGAGVAYSIKDIITVRAGYHYGPSDKALPSYAALGLEGGYRFIKLRAAYLLGSETLGNSLQAGLVVSF